VVKDIVKMFYDKKTAGTQQQTKVIPTTPPSADKLATVLTSASAEKPAASQPLVATVGGPRR
jgi:hypothetical protein